MPTQKNYVVSFKKNNKKPLESVINYNNPEAIDLIDKMLVFNPNKRITVETAIQHSYVQSIKEDGVVDPKFEGTLNFDFDYDINITKDQLLQLLMKEIKSFDSGVVG